jgi:hypothetical protein
VISIPSVASIEDTPVTLQIGLVGTDGIVLAGDLKTRFFDEVETFGLTSKILTSARGIALAYSGYEISREVAKRIIADETLLDFDDSAQWQTTEKIASDVYREPFPDIVAPDRRDSEILLVSTCSIDHFYSLEMRNENRCWLRRREDKAIAGHVVNSGCFFVERYYRKSATVEELALVAAYAIFAASKLNPPGIEGLEMVTCTKAEIGRMPDGDIKSLESRCREIDKEIEALLLLRD